MPRICYNSYIHKLRNDPNHMCVVLAHSSLPGLRILALHHFCFLGYRQRVCVVVSDSPKEKTASTRRSASGVGVGHPNFH